MLSSHSLPETQAALALSIFFATFIYEDGATLLAASLSAGGGLDPRIGLFATFLGIWVGDMGLYGLGSSFGRRTARSRWLQKYLRPESLAKAERWFARHGSLALVMSRAIPGSRLPLYVAAGALRLPVRLFAKITAACSAVWVSAIFALWRFIPKASSGHQKLLPWMLTAVVLFAPWLLSKSAKSLGEWIQNRETLRDCPTVSYGLRLRASRVAVGPQIPTCILSE
jgi:membrane protein DedA with SNARE-associated domain